LIFVSEQIFDLLRLNEVKKYPEKYILVDFILGGVKFVMSDTIK